MHWAWQRLLGWLAKSAGLHVYQYPKADVTATVVVFFDDGRSALVVRRKHQPFKGGLAFPGGFLEAGKETLQQCAARELAEETSIPLSPAEMIPVDERSAIDRDPRGHVIDHGFCVSLPGDRKQEMAACDDAEDVQVVAVADLLEQGMSFDHADLLRSALAKEGYQAC
jgi:8-oxo-dGTP diphosphatase